MFLICKLLSSANSCAFLFTAVFTIRCKIKETHALRMPLHIIREVVAIPMTWFPIFDSVSAHMDPPFFGTSQ